MTDPHLSVARGDNDSSPYHCDSASLCPPMDPEMLHPQLQLNQHTFKNRLHVKYNIRVLCHCPRSQDKRRRQLTTTTLMDQMTVPKNEPATEKQSNRPICCSLPIELELNPSVPRARALIFTITFQHSYH